MTLAWIPISGNVKLGPQTVEPTHHPDRVETKWPRSVPVGSFRFSLVLAE